MRLWRPVFTELQVCPMPDGRVCLSVAAPQAPVVVFDLGAEECRHLVVLLQAALHQAEERAKADAGPAAQACAGEAMPGAAVAC